jgi:hypothetical protein
MNTEYTSQRRSPQAYATLIEDAKLRATELRAEAIRAFWAGLAQAARRAWRAVRRAALPSPAHPTRSSPPCPR